MNELLKKSLEVVGQALNMANKAGVFNLSDSAQIYNAMANLTQAISPENIKTDENPIADPSKAKGEVVQMKAVKEAKSKK